MPWASVLHALGLVESAARFEGGLGVGAAAVVQLRWCPLRGSAGAARVVSSSSTAAHAPVAASANHKHQPQAHRSLSFKGSALAGSGGGSGRHAAFTHHSSSSSGGSGARFVRLGGGRYSTFSPFKHAAFSSSAVDDSSSEGAYADDDDGEYDDEADDDDESEVEGGEGDEDALLATLAKLDEGNPKPQTKRDYDTADMLDDPFAHVAGLCKWNPVGPQRLKAPGFNP